MGKSASSRDSDDSRKGSGERVSESGVNPRPVEVPKPPPGGHLKPPSDLPASSGTPPPKPKD